MEAINEEDFVKNGFSQHVEAVREQYDRVAPRYASHFTDAMGKAEDREVARRLSWLRNEHVAGKILDLGCGDGHLVTLASPPPRRYVGIDISPKMIALARQKHPGYDFRIGDMHNLGDFRDNSFDSVISTFGSLSYSLAPTIVINEIQRVLAPTGRFWLQVLSWRYFFRTSHIVNNHLDFVGYTEERLRNLFRNFRHVRVTGINVVGHVMPWLIGLEARTVGRRWPNLAVYLVVEGFGNA